MTQSTDWPRKRDVSVMYTFIVFRSIELVISSPQCVVIPKVIARYHGDPCTTRYPIHFSDAFCFTPHEEFKYGFGSTQSSSESVISHHLSFSCKPVKNLLYDFDGGCTHIHDSLLILSLILTLDLTLTNG